MPLQSESARRCCAHAHPGHAWRGQTAQSALWTELRNQECMQRRRGLHSCRRIALPASLFVHWQLRTRGWPTAFCATQDHWSTRIPGNDLQSYSQPGSHEGLHPWLLDKVALCFRQDMLGRVERATLKFALYY